MYNENIPTKAELPTTKQLIKSTCVSIVAAFVLLITIVLPSEYAIDPTGVGSVLGLTEMGEIKQQLSEEAEQDRHNTSARPVERSFFEAVMSVFFVKSAQAQSTENTWKDVVSFDLVPGEGTEYKLVMRKGAVASFDWSVEGGRANYDLHGDNANQSTSYKKGRGVTGEVGELTAKFDGNHGWFWRNRDKQKITITLRVKGDYSELKFMK